MTNRLEVRPRTDGEKGFELVLHGAVIGYSKTDCDARFNMYKIDEALASANAEGYKDGYSAGYDQGREDGEELSIDYGEQFNG
jgi:hypothetical protein